MKTYELMDLDTANVVGFYETETAALAVVRGAITQYGEEGVLDLALSERSCDGSAVLLAEGPALMRRASCVPEMAPNRLS